ncbi:hypothetical protein [Saccharothrix carnea]|uniref:hypothetical protein n=1 Tax=Saccharothrix carnea TaxID=1280637 RepID=UPI000D0CEF27|nr:hypothetical protein [Saccharothrix carnea]
MDLGAFARYLGRLDRVELDEVRRVRREARKPPLPDEPRALAKWLSDEDTVAAIRLMSQDALAVGRVTADLGWTESCPELRKTSNRQLAAVQ